MFQVDQNNLFYLLSIALVGVVWYVIRNYISNNKQRQDKREQFEADVQHMIQTTELLIKDMNHDIKTAILKNESFSKDQRSKIWRVVNDLQRDIDIIKKDIEHLKD